MEKNQIVNPKMFCYTAMLCDFAKPLKNKGQNKQQQVEYDRLQGWEWTQTRRPEPKQVIDGIEKHLTIGDHVTLKSVQQSHKKHNFDIKIMLPPKNDDVKNVGSPDKHEEDKKRQNVQIPFENGFMRHSCHVIPKLSTMFHNYIPYAYLYCFHRPVRVGCSSGG